MASPGVEAVGDGEFEAGGEPGGLNEDGVLGLGVHHRELQL